MNTKFDELAKGLAQAVTRRQALKRFGTGLAGMALACFGVARRADAKGVCNSNADCTTGLTCCHGQCVNLMTDLKNCGKCGNNCYKTPASTYWVCMMGNCWEPW